MSTEGGARSRFSRVDTLFQAVCDLPEGERRERLLVLAPDDPAIVQEVLALLSADADANARGRLSVSGAISDIARTIADAGTEPVTIPGLRIVRTLGEGGMGVVYEAEQEMPRRMVALKLLRPGLATPELIGRFEFEVEALARLRHPAIAQIYEAGVAQGAGGPRPYFAMELVRGETLDAWIARTKPSTRERLEVVARICDAVQHAHARGIVHRDLKPANILVATAADPAGAAPRAGSRAARLLLEPEIKILDFGVAKAIDPALHRRTLHTSSGQLVGTLPYMSPEQLSGDPDETDVRTDVYTLGVVLFEALSAALPHEVGHLSPAAAIRAITEGTPRRLSSLDASLRGDVETIVSTAMNPDKSRRYQTAAALGDDIRRFLANETIAARPASVTYQLSRLARRHRPAVAALGIVLVAIVVAGVVSGVALVGERRARAHAVGLNDSLTATNDRLAAQNANYRAAISFLRDMLTRANADNADKDQTTLLQVLDGAAASVRSGESPSPEVEATLRTTLGATYGWMGQYEEALELLVPALDIRTRLFGDTDPATIETLIPLARFMAISGDAPGAIELIGDRPERLRPLAGTDGDRLEAIADLLRVKSVACKFAGRSEEVEPLLAQAAEIYEALGRNNGALGEVFNELATLRKLQERFQEAEDLYVRSLEVYGRVYGDDSERYATVLNNQALNLLALGRGDEAEAAMRRSLEISTAIYGETTPGRVMGKRANFGSLLIGRGRFAQAEEVLRQTIVEHERVLPPEHPSGAFPRMFMAEALLELRRPEEALGHARAASAIFIGAYGPDSSYVVRAQRTESAALERTGHMEEAIGAMEGAIHATITGFGADSVYLPLIEFDYAMLLARAGRPEEGMETWSRASARLDAMPAENPMTQTLRADRLISHAAILDAIGRGSEALVELDQWWGAVGKPEWFRFMMRNDQAASLRIRLLRDAGRQEDAAACAQLLYDGAVQTLGADHPRTLEIGADR
jgi:serine/threonine protein kinase